MTQTGYELIEVDPASGEETELIATGTLPAMERELRSQLEEHAESWDEWDSPWLALRIQPAQ
jgi:hypothetical protein